MTRYYVIFGNPAKEPTVTVAVTAETERKAISKAKQILGSHSRTIRVTLAPEGTA